MPKCSLAPPPLYEIRGGRVAAGDGAAGDGRATDDPVEDADRAVACYLQEQAPALTREALPDLLARV
jgi:hypothetical protein